MVECRVVQDCFPSAWKEGEPPRVPPTKFFLVTLDDDSKIAMAVFIFGLYTMCNEIRHGAGAPHFKKTLCRIMREIYMKPSVLAAWEKLFGFTSWDG